LDHEEDDLRAPEKHQPEDSEARYEETRAGFASRAKAGSRDAGRHQESRSRRPGTHAS
jgi:hypothetical protein